MRGAGGEHFSASLGVSQQQQYDGAFVAAPAGSFSTFPAGLRPGTVCFSGVGDGHEIIEDDNVVRQPFRDEQASPRSISPSTLADVRDFIEDHEAPRSVQHDELVAGQRDNTAMSATASNFVTDTAQVYGVYSEDQLFSPVATPYFSAAAVAGNSSFNCHMIMNSHPVFTAASMRGAGGEHFSAPLGVSQQQQYDGAFVAAPAGSFSTFPAGLRPGTVCFSGVGDGHEIIEDDNVVRQPFRDEQASPRSISPSTLADVRDFIEDHEAPRSVQHDELVAGQRDNTAMSATASNFVTDTAQVYGVYSEDQLFSPVATPYFSAAAVAGNSSFNCHMIMNSHPVFTVTTAVDQHHVASPRSHATVLPINGASSRRRRRSAVFEHMDLDSSNTIASCKYCPKRCSAKPQGGTKHLIRHVCRCLKKNGRHEEADQLRIKTSREN